LGDLLRKLLLLGIVREEPCGLAPTPDLIPLCCRSLVQEDLKKYKMPHLRHCVSAGEPLNEEVIYNWEEATGIVIKGQ
jgi:hypothetical protein